MQNRKILLSTAMFIVLMAGCAPYTNIVKSVNSDNIVVRDVETNTERRIVFDNNEKHLCFLKYLYNGDTVLVKSRNYNDSVLHTKNNKSEVYFCVDTINSRYQAALSQKTR